MQDEVGRFPVGAYRTDQVWIGASHRIEDATFVPAPPARIQGCMDEMAASILQYAPRSDEQGELSLVAQLAIAHPQFETIHPYHDGNGRTRSEEHTSELQSLMRISYAVFCLKKKKQQIQNTNKSTR